MDLAGHGVRVQGDSANHRFQESFLVCGVSYHSCHLIVCNVSLRLWDYFENTQTRVFLIVVAVLIGFIAVVLYETGARPTLCSWTWGFPTPMART